MNSPRVCTDYLPMVDWSANWSEGGGR
jgi:hypothetical protein